MEFQFLVLYDRCLMPIQFMSTLTTLSEFHLVDFLPFSNLPATFHRMHTHVSERNATESTTAPASAGKYSPE